MRLSSRLSAAAMVAITGLTLTVTAAAAAAPFPGMHAVARDAATTASSGDARVQATASGTRLWAARVTGRFRNDQGAAGFAAATSPRGSAVFVTGDATTTSKGRQHGATLAYNPATGTPLWRATYLPGGRVASRFLDIAVSPDGSTVFVAGEAGRDVPVSGHFAAAAYDAGTGAQLWAQQSATMGMASSVAVSPDGATVFVTSNGRAGAPTTVAYSAKTGTVLWSQSAGLGGRAVSAAVSPDGSAVFVTGLGSTGAPATVAYNATTGTPLWTEPASITPLALAVSPDGARVYLTGEGSNGSGTQAYDAATGATLWTAPTASAGPDAIAVSPDGSTVFVTGFASGRHSPAKFYGTRALDAATGTARWTARYRAPTKSPAAAIASSIVVSPDGSKVFITGSMPGPNSAGGYGTVGYDATNGTLLWAAHYGNADGLGTSVGVSPNGAEVFVTGEIITVGPPSRPFMATLAYSS